MKNNIGANLIFNSVSEIISGNTYMNFEEELVGNDSISEIQNNDKVKELIANLSIHIDKYFKVVNTKNEVTLISEIRECSSKILKPNSYLITMI